MVVLYLRTPSGRKRLILKAAKREEGVKTGYSHTAMQAEAEGAETKLRAGKVGKVGAEKIESVIKRELKTIRESMVAIPPIKTPKPEEPPESEIRMVNIKYPLISSGQKVFAYAHIFFDRGTNQIVYNVVEPPLPENQAKLLNEIKDYIQDKLNINFAQIRKAESVNYITDIFEKAAKYFRVKGDTEILKYYVIKDFIGLGTIEPFMQDKNIEDISCDGVEIPIYIYHRDPKIASVPTNVAFTDRDELDSFVNKLAERCGKTISFARPLLDGTLPDGSRVQATLGSDIARRGSNFTIRLFTEKPLTPIDIINFGTADLKLMAYLWFLVEHESSILVSGGTATGKTSLLNVLSLFIRPQMKIVSIEDTSELRLPHPHWVPEVARTPIAEEGKVDMFELLKESLRQRPDYIVVGEVRGKEAYVLFQQMAVGHAGLATIHADSFSKLLDRLTTPPISLPANLIQNLDAIVFIRRIKRGRRYIRRVSSVTEILGYDYESNAPIFEELFRWSPADRFDTAGKSAILGKISTGTGMSEGQIQRELVSRAKVLEWMVRNNIKDYRRISSVINMYYLSPEMVMKRIEGT